MRHSSIIALSGILFLLSCGKDSGTIESLKPQEISYEATYIFYDGDTAPSKNGAVAMLEMDGDVLGALYDANLTPAGHNVFYFQDSYTHTRSMCLLHDDYMLFAPLEAEGSVIKPVVAFYRETGFGTVYSGEIDIRTGKYTVQEVIPLEAELASTKGGAFDLDDIRMSFVDGILRPLEEWGTDIDQKIRLITLGQFRIGKFISSMTKYVAINGKVMLMSGAGQPFQQDMFSEVGTEISNIIVDESLDMVSGAVAAPIKLKIKSVLDMEEVAKSIVLYSVLAYKRAFPSDAQAKAAIDETIGPAFVRGGQMLPASRWSPLASDCISPFNISFKVTNVGKNSATFSGSSTFSQFGQTHAADALIESGFAYYPQKGGEKKFVTSEGLQSKTVTLREATAYSAAAYMHTLSGKDWYSSSVNFVTKGTRIEFSPKESFEFGLKGGEQTTDVIVGDFATWKVESAPSWCTVGYSDKNMWVTVAEGKTEEQGEIVVSTTSPYGETDRASIPVSRTEILGWDGTKWRFEGNSAWIEISIQNAANGVYTTEYNRSGWGDLIIPGDEEFIMTLEDNGDLKLVDHYETWAFHKITSDTIYIIKRTGEDTAVMQGSRVDVQEGYGVTCDYKMEFTGKRI